MIAFVPPQWLSRAFLRLPRPLRALLLGRSVVIDGQTLDRQTQLLLWAERKLPVPALGAGPVEAARASFRRTAVLLAPRPPRHDRRELTVQGATGPLRARAYAPPGQDGVTLPGLVFLHGGGWVVGDLDTHDAVCADLAANVGCRVIAVDYRLAPEHPFPAPGEDAWAAFRDVVARADELGLDPARVGIGGDSAGANLSAAVSLMARDAGGPAPRVQALLYGSHDQSRDFPSTALFGKGFLLTSDDVAWFRRHYFAGPDDARDWRASPLLGDLRGVAPALIVSAGFDPLRDESTALAEAMRAAGVPVTLRCEADLVHGWLNLAGSLGAARRALDALAADLRERL